jgi:hypothetical protein
LKLSTFSAMVSVEKVCSSRVPLCFFIFNWFAPRNSPPCLKWFQHCTLCRLPSSCFQSCISTLYTLTISCLFFV